MKTDKTNFSTIYWNRLFPAGQNPVRKVAFGGTAPKGKVSAGQTTLAKNERRSNHGNETGLE